MSTTATQPEASVPASDGRARRKKRTRFLVPHYKPRPVKALWESATDEERTRAHKTSMVILEYWTARLSKQEAAAKLGLAPIRVWQLSQQAVVGMLAGLLTQPRDRGAGPGKGELERERRSARERALEKRVAQLEAELDTSHRLIEVMRELPVVRAKRAAGGPGIEPGSKRGKQSARKSEGRAGSGAGDGRTDGRRARDPAGAGDGA